MTKRPEELFTADEVGIVEQAKQWCKQKSTAELNGHYHSPRVSSELPDCSMPMTFDQYNFCSGSCLYCFSYYFKTNNPSYRNKNVPLKAVDVDDVILAMQGSKKASKRGQTLYHHFYKRKFLLHWGGMADPFCGVEARHRVGIKLIEALGEMNYPTLFSFKGPDIFSKAYVKLFSRYAEQCNFAFQVSIVTNSDELSRQIEIGMPITSRRLEAIKMLSDMGYYCILRLRPFIMGVTDVGLDELLHRALAVGISGISTEWFALDSRATPDAKRRFGWLGRLMGVGEGLLDYFSVLSPSERGGYMRLNRKVKESYAKQIYQFCVEHNLTCGISDPDFKELNTSGSCCGMPDNFPKNHLLENWTRNQLTFHLKEARRQYHKNGVQVRLYFHDVYGNESYFDDWRLVTDHVSEVNQCMAVRRIRTFRMILRNCWNNLRSPANPCNYLHGKIMPVGTDGNGDLIYQYEPMDYEERWRTEGIDLTR